MKKSTIAGLLLIISAGLVGTAVHAADLGGMKDTSIDTAVSREHTLAGLTVGVFAGVDIFTGDVKNSYSESLDFDKFSASYNERDTNLLGMQGATFGGGISYLFNFGKLYAGPWVDVDYSTASVKQTDTWSYSDSNGDSGGDSHSVTFEKSWGWSGGLMVGAEVSQGTLLYGKGGFAQGKFKLSGTDISAANGFNTAPDIDGWTIGGGLRQAIGNGWSIGAEYMYTQYDTANIFSASGSESNWKWSEKADIGLDEHTARITLTKTLY